jgi:hypothetical protein
LTLGGVVHFLRVFRDKRVEESVEALVVPSLGSEDTPETLSFLSTRGEMGRDLDKACSFGQIDRGVADLLSASDHCELAYL